jgi:hypothetical protein
MPSSGSGTGTQVSGGQSITAQNLVDQAQNSLDDSGASVFSEAELLQWLNEAIREYSQHFPRKLYTDITAVADTREYNVAWNANAILSVEYPYGQDPPEYSHRRHYAARGWSDDEFYDFVSRKDLTATPQIWLSFEPTADEVLRVFYTAPHVYTLILADNVTVPGEHHHVLIQYVLFAAARQLQQAEQASPTNSSSLLMAQLANNTRRLELAYLNALNRILFHRQGNSQAVVWGEAPGVQRIY